MELPPALLDVVRPELKRILGDGGSIHSIDSVRGGCINPSARIDTTGGESFFLKWNADHPGLFVPEAEGLRELGRGGEVRVPRVHAVGEGGGPHREPGWLLLEFVGRGSAGEEYSRTLGRGLAALHRRRGRASGWGWGTDNFIGSLAQGNGPCSSWADFWVRRRLEPQLDLARQRRAVPGSERSWDELFAVIPSLLAPAEEDGPSLLHGDLWSGNVFAGPDGEPILIDPAVYRGHREVDLAMTELFGGFSADFYDAYDEVWPIRRGYREVRKHLYQLYPLLVHVNLFGAGYVGRTEAALQRVLSTG